MAKYLPLKHYSGGPDAAPVTTDGPLPETSDLVAGLYMVDVESRERAIEIAAHQTSHLLM